MKRRDTAPDKPSVSRHAVMEIVLTRSGSSRTGTMDDGSIEERHRLLTVKKMIWIVRIIPYCPKTFLPMARARTTELSRIADWVTMEARRG